MAPGLGRRRLSDLCHCSWYIFPLHCAPTYLTLPRRTRGTQIYITTQTRPLCGSPWHQAIYQVDSHHTKLISGYVHNTLLINASPQYWWNYSVLVNPNVLPGGQRRVSSVTRSVVLSSPSRLTSWQSDGTRPCASQSTSPPSPCQPWRLT